MDYEKILTASRIIIADGVLIKNNTELTSSEAKSARPYEIPPEGYHIASEEERNLRLTGARFAYFFEGDKKWSFDAQITDRRPPEKHIAIPDGYSEDIKKMTVAEICDEPGYDVEVVQ